MTGFLSAARMIMIYVDELPLLDRLAAPIPGTAATAVAA
jgi:hypothetical protein